MSRSEYYILIVDDEPKVTFFFQQHLQLVNKNYQVETAGSGTEALEKLEQKHYDLLISDLRMPDMSGLELIRHVKVKYPETKTILVTAYGSNEVWEEAHKLNISRSLTKPVNISDLLQAVGEALQKEGIKQEKKLGILSLSGEKFEELSECLEQLRVDTSALAATIVDTTGRMIVFSGNIEDIDTSSILGLLGGTMAASSELGSQVGYQKQIHLSYFEGPPFNLYASNIGKDFFLTIFQRPGADNGRIGVVWLYTRRALDQFEEILSNESLSNPSLLEPGFVESIQGELLDFFDEAEAGEPQAPNRTEEKASPSAAPSTQEKPSLFSRLKFIVEQVEAKAGIEINTKLDVLDQMMPPRLAGLILETVNLSFKFIVRDGNSSKATIIFKQGEKMLSGLIWNNGTGTDEEGSEVLRDLIQLKPYFLKLGGDLEISGIPNKGTTVTLSIPVAHLSLTPRSQATVY